MALPRFTTLAVVFGVAASVAACGRSGEKSSPPAEVQTRSPVEQVNAPVKLTGCLRAGDAADTFVLTTARSAEGEQTATYQLTGGPSDRLREQIGKQVEVSGIVRTQQRSRSLSETRSAERAKGTSGTPSVSTRTDLQIRQLEVRSMRPLGDRCEMR